MRPITSAALFASATVGGLAALSFADESYFRGIGRAPDNSLPANAFGYSRAYGISGDGNTVVGSYYTNTLNIGEAPFVLPLSAPYFSRLPGIVNDRSGEARAAAFSGNGVIVGRLRRSGADRAARWQKSGDVYTATTFNTSSGVTPTLARDVSANGNVIVGEGTANFGVPTAFFITGNAPRTLPAPTSEPSGVARWATGVSANGNEISGYTRGLSTGNQIAVRWLRVSTTSYNPTIVSVGNNIRSSDTLQGVSADSAFVVGSMQLPPFPAGFTTPVRSRRGEAAEAVGPVGSFGLPLARATSAAGAVVVGDWGFSGSAFVWKSDQGFRFLQDVATDVYGLNLAGWQLDSATGISDDGRTIVGRGTNPFGWEEGFVIFLGDLPVGCPADWDGDDDIDSDDIVAFFGDWEFGQGDFDGDDDTDSDDVIGFFTSWDTGC